MNEVPGWSHETALAAEPVSASKARDFVCEHLVAHGLLYLVEDVRLVTSELTTNAMVHARTPFVVTLSRTDGIVLLTVRDGLSLVPVKAVPHLMDMNGRGLMLVELLSQAWGASTESDGAKSVWASFSTRPVSGPAPVVA